MATPYISEVKYLGGAHLDFIEIVVDAGTDISDIFVTVYNPDGTVRTVNPLGTLVTTISGKDVYVLDTVTSATFNGLHKNGAVALEQGGSLLSFSSFGGNTVTASGGIAAGQTSTSIGSAGAGESLETSDGGATYFTQTTPNSGSVPCLCAGTRIATVRGSVPVEDLQPGDRVITADGPPAVLRRVMSRKIPARKLARNPKLLPVRISAGALGPGIPSRDIWASRQHRFLVSSPVVKRMLGQQEALLAAIRLTQLKGVFVDAKAQDVTYFHLIFDQHQIVFADGAATESLLLAPGTLVALGSDVAAEILTLFTEFGGTSQPMPACRPIPKIRLQKKIVTRHLKNNKHFQSVA